MGLTERHWFENEDVPENYEWALEDAVYNSRTNKKQKAVESFKYSEGRTERVINDLNVVKLMLCNPQMLTPEMCIRIGQAVTSAITLLKEQEVRIKELEEKLKTLKYGDQDIIRCKNCAHNGKVEKCVLAAIAAEKGVPLFMLDNYGEWFCADGERR